MSHCGVDAFQLFKGENGWKITQISDTRRRENCQTEPAADVPAIHRLMDAWHHAAAVADEDTFFGSMTPDGIYLGTDATERWLRDDMREWSKKYFDQETAWAFTAHDRQVYLSSDGQTAWFEELLDTWMGVCRGSGVLQKTSANGGWKIRHYDLAVTVPNEVINGFIELVKNAPEKKD
ncbi:MAG: nuclear transport factor 2 family protein [Bacteroidetes bacterium]|nr:nuclear transport factor 2 family protein [Bacteroidota bacterium]